MPKTLKQILSGFMIFGDLFLLIFFIVDLMEGYDVGIDLFIIMFLLVDSLLSIDYIIGLNKKEKLESRIAYTEDRLYNAQEINTDHEIAESLRLRRQEQEERRRQEEQQRSDSSEYEAWLKGKEQQKENKPEELDPEELRSMLQRDYQDENKTGTY